jgi:hypothetical protein
VRKERPPPPPSWWRRDGWKKQQKKFSLDCLRTRTVRTKFCVAQIQLLKIRPSCDRLPPTPRPPEADVFGALFSSLLLLRHHQVVLHLNLLTEYLYLQHFSLSLFLCCCFVSKWP